MNYKNTLKRLEKNIYKNKKKRIINCHKKYDEDVYRYKNKIYVDTDKIRKDAGMSSQDILVIITDFQWHNPRL